MRNFSFTKLKNYFDTDTKPASISTNKFLEKFKTPLVGKKSTTPVYMMPQIGRSLVHDEGVTLLLEYLEAIEE